MVRIQFHAEADLEVDAVFDWYEQQQPGLGADFLAELRSHLQAIAEAPRAAAAWSGARGKAMEVRRRVMRQFPFTLPYVVREDLVLVLAVAHVRRQPGYWLKRALTRP